MLQDGKPPREMKDLGLRRMFCDFLAACAYIAVARAEDNIEASVSGSHLVNTIISVSVLTSAAAKLSRRAETRGQLPCFITRPVEFRVVQQISSGRFDIETPRIGKVRARGFFEATGLGCCG